MQKQHFTRCCGCNYLLTHVFININVVWVAVLRVYSNEDVNRLFNVCLEFAIDY